MIPPVYRLVESAAAASESTGPWLIVCVRHCPDGEMQFTIDVYSTKIQAWAARHTYNDKPWDAIVMMAIDTTALEPAPLYGAGLAYVVKRFILDSVWLEEGLPIPG